MCPKCNKPVVFVKEGEEENNAINFSVLGSLENTLMLKLQESSKRLRGAKDLDEERELGNLLNIWLEVIERLKRVQKMFSSVTPS